MRRAFTPNTRSCHIANTIMNSYGSYVLIINNTANNAAHHEIAYKVDRGHLCQLTAIGRPQHPKKTDQPTASLIAMFPYERSEAIMALSIELSRNVLSQAL